MQIGKINNLNFGATPDINTRMILKTANMKGVDTVALEDLMKEIYADKYVMTNTRPDGTYTVGIYNKNEGYAELARPLMKFDKNNSISSIVRGLIAALSSAKADRSKEQKVIDRIENKFGRYDEPDAYKHATSYLA